MTKTSKPETFEGSLTALEELVRELEGGDKGLEESLALFVLGAVSMFASGFFIGAAMRLLAEKPWMKAAGWALLAAVLSHARTPRAILFAAPGCFLGAYLCDRYRREERWLEDTEGFLRSWMFWERGGAL